MTADKIFSIANMIALLSWLFLLLAPRFVVTSKIILSGAIPLLLSVAYLILIVLFFGKADGGFDSLPNVMKLFTNEWAVLAGWIHYLAFDLFVGSWEVKDAQERGISHWFVIPCLVLTFLFGPIGFLLYSILRFFLGKEVKND
jgi:prepilin signal peptidase PulO-like enzyme (type II secretory pathway)